MAEEKARAYVLRGHWVADCTRPYCANAEFLFGEQGRPREPRPGDPRKLYFLCSVCRQVAQIDWPPDLVMEQIAAVLALRPVPGTRNWFPKDHAGAVRLRVVHGQTVEQLRAENAEHGVPA